MARIDWGVGSVTDTLGSPRPDPANRLFDCVPKYVHNGPIRVTIARTRHAFTFDEYYTLSFTIKHLTPDLWADALALQKWLMTSGNTVTLVTGDLDDAEYDGLTLAPGTEPTITNDDDERQHFSFACVLAGNDPITVNYDG